MSSPPRGQPATAAVPAVAAATSPQLPAASHTLPRAFLATSSPRAIVAAPAPPLFTGRPLNPNPPAHGSSVPHGILYPVLKSASTSNSAAAAVTAQLRRVPPMAVGYPRTHAVAIPIAQQQQPLVHAQPRSFAAVPRALVTGVSTGSEQPPRGVPIGSQPKVSEFLFVSCKWKVN